MGQHERLKNHRRHINTTEKEQREWMYAKVMFISEPFDKLLMHRIGEKFRATEVRSVLPIPERKGGTPFGNRIVERFGTVHAETLKLRIGKTAHVDSHKNRSTMAVGKGSTGRKREKNIARPCQKHRKSQSAINPLFYTKGQIESDLLLGKPRRAHHTRVLPTMAGIKYDHRDLPCRGRLDPDQGQ